MANRKINLLHISDLHIVVDKNNNSYSPFHEALKQSIIEEFGNKTIDFVIVSGDLGHQGDETNMEMAILWIEEIRDNLKLKNSQFVFCAGNHDLIRNCLEKRHHKMCFNYVTGQNYITSKIPLSAFETFYNKINTAFPNIDTHVHKTELDDYIYDTEDVRFYCINSSWLSQINSEEENRIRTECEMQTDIQEKYQYLKSEYDEIVCLNPAHPKYIQKYTFNHSENTRQQIDYGFIKLFEKLKPDEKKLNILVFHHPEFCLHPLEHFAINGIDYSGSYLHVSSQVDILLCGHIHPDFPQEIKNKRYKIPHFIGATGHDDPKKDKKRPIFFSYELTLENEVIECNRIYYQQSDDGMSFQAYRKPDSVSLPKNKFTSQRQINSNVKLNSESDIGIINEKIKHVYFCELETYLKLNGATFIRDEVKFETPNKTDNPDYYIINNAVKYTINAEFEVIFDLISSNIFMYPNFLQCRLDRNILKYNSDILMDNSKKSLYLPIVIDLYSSLLDDTGSNDHRRFCELEMGQYYQTNEDKFVWLDVFLRKKIPEITWSIFPNILQINKLVFLGARLINKLLIDNIEAKDINYDGNTLDLH